VLLEWAARTEERTIATKLRQIVEQLGPQRLTGLLQRPWRAWLYDSTEGAALDTFLVKAVRSLDLNDLTAMQVLLRKDPRLVNYTGQVSRLLPYGTVSYRC
jgi:hypothetical protein